MNKPKFKPGQQWLSRDGKRTFHILSKGYGGGLDCICITGDLEDTRVWFFDSGMYYRFRTDHFDLVALVKDVE